MSFCGHLSLTPETPVALDRMLRAITLGSPRQQRRWASAGARLAVADGASLASGAGDRAALLDGEIHNRADLARALGIDGGRQLSDAALVLEAQARWGDDYAEHIVGDFACAVWDGARRRLVAAVDPGGMRPLLLWHDGASLRLANEARGLFADPAVDRVVDEHRVAHWLSILPSPPDRTFFRGIRRVPPGGRAIWRDGAVSIDQWWHPERLSMLRLPRHADYAEAVRACLDDAVACRLGTGEHVGSNLSGGLDSSAVTALAATRLAAQGRRLVAFTATPARTVADPPGRFADEWSHAAALAAMYPNIDHVRVSNDDRPIMEMFDAREAVQDVPLFNLSNTVWNNAIEREARDRGVAIMLTGSGGNMTFSYHSNSLVRMQLRRGRVDQALATLIAMRRAQKLRLRTLAAILADASLPPRWTAYLRGLIGTRSVEFSDYSLITPAFLGTAGLAGEARAQGGDLRDLYRDDSRALRMAAIRRFDVQGDFATATRRLYGLDTRDPTSDRRLVELCLSIPEDQFQHKGVPRSIARSALAGALPPAMLGEQRKGLQAADWAYGIDAAVPALREEVARQRANGSLSEWIDLDRAQAMLDGWSSPADGDAVEAVAVTRALAAGRFVRRLQGGNA